MIRTVNFIIGDTTYTCDSLSLVLTDCSIAIPTPKTYSVDIPFRNGSLDLTDYFGGLKYDNRPIELKFNSTIKSNQTQRVKKIVNLLNGKKMKLVFSFDENHYYEGRATVSHMDLTRQAFNFKLSVDCQPYKLEVEETSVNLVAGDNVLENDEKIVNATITNGSQSNTVTFGGSVNTLSANETFVIQLTSGTNTINITNNATITYRKGCL